MRAPFASTVGIAIVIAPVLNEATVKWRKAGLLPTRLPSVCCASRSARLAAEHLERPVRRLIEQLEQRPRRTAWLALALLPVAHRLDRHADAGGELGLREPGLRADAARIAGVDRRRPLRRNRRRQHALVGFRRRQLQRRLAA